MSMNMEFYPSTLMISYQFITSWVLVATKDFDQSWHFGRSKWRNATNMV